MKKKESSQLLKNFRIIGIITLFLIVYSIVDLAQALKFNNSPIISLKIRSDGRGGRYEYGLLFRTHVYCNNDKEVKVAWKNYFKPYYYKGCEGEEAEELIKSSISRLAGEVDYAHDSDYIFLTTVLTGAIPTIETMYYRGDFTDEEALASVYVINGLADCDKKDKIDNWNTAKEFYDLWKDSKCRKSYMKKHKFK